MTDPIEAARLEHEHPGTAVSQEEQDGWLKAPKVTVLDRDVDTAQCTRAFRPKAWPFDPTTPISGVACRLLKASNAMTFADGRGHRDGRFDEPGTTRHAGWKP